MQQYVGLDVPLMQTWICVVDQSGSVLREGVVDSDPDAIAAFVRSHAPGVARIGLESGPTATWLWTELKRFGLPVICIDARHGEYVEVVIEDQNRPARTGGSGRFLFHGDPTKSDKASPPERNVIRGSAALRSSARIVFEFVIKNQNL